MADDTKPFITVEELNLHEIGRLWRGIDTDVLGRFLRAHLVIEHFVDEYLRSRNPNLGDFRRVRVTFHQKLGLLDGNAALVNSLLPGIKRINALRNKFAHDINYVLTSEDVQSFLDDGFFTPWLVAYKKREGLDMETPIVVVEAFAEFAAAMLRMGKALEAKFEDFEHRHRQIEAEFREEKARLEGAREVLDEWQKAIDEDDEFSNSEVPGTRERS